MSDFIPGIIDSGEDFFVAAIARDTHQSAPSVGVVEDNALIICPIGAEASERRVRNLDRRSPFYRHLEKLAVRKKRHPLSVW